MFGKFLDEYEVGESWASRGRTVTEADLVSFAGISGDFFPLHTDEEYARASRFGGRIAHGLLVLSMASGLWEMNPQSVLAFYGLDRLRFVTPTFIGDTIHIESEVLQTDARGEANGVLAVRQEITKQTGEVAVVTEVRMLLASRPVGDQPMVWRQQSSGKSDAFGLHPASEQY